jgi:probable rRNA maturation factor
MQNLTLDFSYECELWHDELPDLEELTRLAALKTLEFTGYTAPQIEISTVFADDTFIQNLNRDYREQDKPTNVLSFPQYEPNELDKKAEFLALGDIILAYETIAREADEQEKSLRAHTVHMIVHSLLHLLGYDHLTDFEAETMEKLEIRILKALGVKNPYETIGFIG